MSGLMACFQKLSKAQKKKKLSYSVIVLSENKQS